MLFVRLLFLILALVLLTSVGGVGVYASPITVPVLFLLGATSTSKAYRLLTVATIALTAGEIALVLVKPGTVDRPAALWLVPIAAIAVAGVATHAAQRALRRWHVQAARRTTTPHVVLTERYWG